MFSNLKTRLIGDKKIKILFVILFIFNIALYVNLFTYNISMEVLHDFVTINCAIIILGFISTRLSKLKELNDSSTYEIGYLILTGLLSLTITYFNKSTNGDSLWAPFIEMFRMLSVLLILTFIATKSRSFKAIVRGDYSRKTVFGQIAICSILAILASYLTLDINGFPANSRDLIVMISGLLGGPYVGIPVGIISGLWRFSLGGHTALACSAGTIGAAIVGSAVHRWNGNEFLKPFKSGLLMFLYIGFDMFLITVMTARPDGIIIAKSLYAPMTFAAVIGILLFSLFLSEKKEEIHGKQKQTTDDKISEILQELKDYKAKVDETERELNEYKNKVEKLKRELTDKNKNAYLKPDEN